MATRKGTKKLSRKEKYRALITRAARDAEFRDRLIVDPLAAAESANIKGLGPRDVAGFRRVAQDLRRFGGNPALNPTDAKSWAIGVMTLKVVPI